MHFGVITDGICTLNRKMGISFAIYKLDMPVSDYADISNLTKDKLITFKSVGDVIMACNKYVIPLVAEISAVFSAFAYMDSSKMLLRDTKIELYSDCSSMISIIENNILRKKNLQIYYQVELLNAFMEKVALNTGFVFSEMVTMHWISGDAMKSSIIKH